MTKLYNPDTHPRGGCFIYYPSEKNMTPDYTNYNNEQLVAELLIASQSPVVPLSAAQLMAVCAERIRQLGTPATPVQLSLF